MLKTSYLMLCLFLGMWGSHSAYSQHGQDKQKSERSEASIIVSDGYQWPARSRDHWPTSEWKTSPMENHGISPDKMQRAVEKASTDVSFRGLLVIKDGYMVFEHYANGSGPNDSSEVWSVTKSFMSALIGIAIDKGQIKHTSDILSDYVPDYPRLEQLQLFHVLTHTTGLNWDESSMEDWIQSKDWVAAVLDKGFYAPPGEALLYSSGNSHLLSALLKKATGLTPGEYAQEHLFQHIGINFTPSNRHAQYTAWRELHVPMPGSWRQDNTGVEIGAFGLHVTAREMAKFGFLYLNKGKWDGKRIVSEAWVKASTRDHVLRTDSLGFGLHWVVSRRLGLLTFEADGWGGQMICVIPSLDMIIVTKYDPINPSGPSSYEVLELAIQAALLDT